MISQPHADGYAHFDAHRAAPAGPGCQRRGDQHHADAGQRERDAAPQHQLELAGILIAHLQALNIAPEITQGQAGRRAPEQLQLALGEKRRPVIALVRRDALARMKIHPLDRHVFEFPCLRRGNGLRGADLAAQVAILIELVDRNLSRQLARLETTHIHELAFRAHPQAVPRMPQAVLADATSGDAFWRSIQRRGKKLQRHQRGQRDQHARHQRQACNAGQRNAGSTHDRHFVLGMHRRKHGGRGEHGHNRQHVDKIDRNLEHCAHCAL